MRNDLNNIETYYAYDKEVIDLSANENQYSEWLNILNLNNLYSSKELSNYGPDFYYELIEKYAKLNNINPNYLITSPGSDAFIYVIFNALTNNSIITLNPDFFRYQEIANILNREICIIDYKDGYIDDLISKTNKENIELIILSNPNNPLGIRHDQKDLLKILDNTDAYIVIDEAYYEFQDESMVKYLKKYPKLIILRTLSKGWGLAGLRCSFTITNPNLIHFLYKIQGPFTLSIVNANIALQILDYSHIMKDMVINTNESKEIFIKLLKEENIELAYPSYANFVYLKNKNAKKIKDTLYEEYNYATSYFHPDGLRISIGKKEDMINLAKILKDIY